MDTTPTTDPDLDAPFARALRERLDAEIPELPDGRGPAHAVARAGARRRNRRVALASVAAAVVVVAAAQVRPDDTRTDLATASEAVRVDPGLQLEWTATDDGLSFVTHHAPAVDGGLYALSTAPRTRPEDHPRGAPRAVYRLGEDGRWEAVPLEGDDPAASRVSERGDVLYALSTGTASGSGGTPVGSASSDGGSTWSSVPLEQAQPPSDDVAWTVTYTMELASDADRTLALVTAHVSVPVDDLFPELRDPETPNVGVRLGEDGVELGQMGDDGRFDEVVRTVPWADLGVDGPGALAPQRWAYVADGDAWNEVATPPLDGGPNGGSTSLQPFAGGFLVTHTEWDELGRPSTQALRTDDGTAWQAIPTPAAGQLLAVGSSLLHVAPRDGEGRGVALQRSTDAGATWTALDLTSLDPTLADAVQDGYAYGGAGPLGVALVVSDGSGPPRSLLFSTDAERWTSADLGAVAPDGASVAEVLVGTDRIVLSAHTAEGEPGSTSRTVTLTAVPRRT